MVDRVGGHVESGRVDAEHPDLGLVAMISIESKLGFRGYFTDACVPRCSQNGPAAAASGSRQPVPPRPRRAYYSYDQPMSDHLDLLDMILVSDRLSFP